MEVTEEERRQVEEQVERLLSGQGSEVTGCDVALDQSKPATLRKTVTFIVCAVIFNDKVADYCETDEYRKTPWHPVTLPVDLSCRHVLQRLVLVFTNAQEQVWILLIKAPALHLPTAAAVKTHAVTWAANMVVQEAMPSSYYDHDVNTLGVFSLQHNGRQHGETDGVCFNTLVALTPDRVQRNEDGEKVEWTGTGEPPPVENPRYVWFKVQKQTLKQKLMEMTKNTSILPIHSLY
eukprot:superscaffoldBa00007500_g22596